MLPPHSYSGDWWHHEFCKVPGYSSSAQNMVTSATDFNKKTRPSYFQIKIEKKKKIQWPTISDCRFEPCCLNWLK